MQLIQTKLQDCFIIKPDIFTDERGYFCTSFKQNTFTELTGLQINFVQDNLSYSHRGVLRGLHAQHGSYAQAKLVQIIQGQVLDVVVDFRPNSTTYLQHIAVKLDSYDLQQIFIPKGCLHGFVALSEQVICNYKCDNFYCKQAEFGVIYNDADLAIDWQLPTDQLIVSAKDLALPNLKQLKNK